MVATTSPIFTSWPSGTFVSSKPPFSATISVETLSVSSVKSGSPSFSKSPDFLCQTETTPLVIDSPTAGIFTSMAMLENYPASAGLIERRVRATFRQQRPSGALGLRDTNRIVEYDDSKPSKGREAAHFCARGHAQSFARNGERNRQKRR